MRKTQIITDEHYHIFNRGVDKRNIFIDQEDFSRFFESIHAFNTIEPIGSIYELSFNDQKPRKPYRRLVDFICYAVHKNHYHFILKQLVDRGIEKFMHRLGLGYTMFFNNKHHRSGALFQGAYKAIHIDSNDYLLRVSAYINLNHEVHQFGDRVSKYNGEFCRSSWLEYTGESNVHGFCKKSIVLSQFKNTDEYQVFAKEALQDILTKRELKDLL